MLGSWKWELGMGQGGGHVTWGHTGRAVPSHRCYLSPLAGGQGSLKTQQWWRSNKCCVGNWLNWPGQRGGWTSSCRTVPWRSSSWLTMRPTRDILAEGDGREGRVLGTPLSLFSSSWIPLGLGGVWRDARLDVLLAAPSFPIPHPCPRWHTSPTRTSVPSAASRSRQ